MGTGPSVILLEFNELTPTLVERFMAEGKLPHFKRFYHESQAYVTDAQEAQDKLNPWIQWVTVHSGMSFAEHGVFHLGDGHKLARKCIWDLLSDAKLPVWVCGSMNPRFDIPLNGYLLPDPWTTNVAPYPDELSPYFRFVQRNVQEHTNDHVPLTRAEYVGFVKFMVAHGLSAATAGTIVQQLMRERLGGSRWKRAVLLDRLQWDVFQFYYRKLRPAFATFFLNSTAHLQHKYWRHMEPEHFTIKPSPEEQAEYESAILFGYQEMDKLLGRFMDLAGRDATLVLCTALGQQPCLTYEDQGGKTFYRPRDFAQVLELAGVNAPYRVAPVMSEQFQVLFDNERDAQRAETLLGALQVDNMPAMLVTRDGAALFSGCKIYGPLPKEAVLRAGGDHAVPFFDIFYQGDGLKSGMHHPDGFLWIRTPARVHRVAPAKVPLRAVAPTVLGMFGIARPSYMTVPSLS
jgi:hypothetical protein